MSDTVNLESSICWLWTCPNCNAENVHMGIPFKEDEDDEAQARDELGIQPWEELPELMTYPDTVCCGKCNLEFFAECEEDDDDV